MTRKSVRLRRQARFDRGREIHIPHSSWARVQRPLERKLIAPEDFWARLGL